MTLLTLLTLFLLNCQLLYSQTGWVLQNSGTVDPLFDTYFFDMNTGIIVGGTPTNTALILRTTNGGSNWDSISPNTTVLLRGIEFTDSFTGFVVGGNATESVILKTTNSGLNWASVNVPTSDALRSVSFSPTGTGFVGYTVGFNGIVFKTIDGGNNWSIQPTNLGTIQLFAVHFTDGVTGTAVGGSQFDTATIIRTTDGGANWIQQNPNTTNLLRGVYFLNSTTGFAVGNNGTILKTSDGGNNWIVKSTTQFLFLRDIYFANSFTGFIVGSGGKVFRTTDTGNNWDSIPSGTSKDLQGVYFVNEFVGTSVGFDGTIIHTNSGGISSNQNTAEAIPLSYTLFQNYPNPFNPVTNLEFGISKWGFVSLKIYNMLGKEVTTLVNINLNSGTYKYNFDASGMTGGVYFYKLVVDGNIIDTKRMVLLK
ncbi:MAG: YCF48-related protein [Bacteroidota bacterium]|nr:YCF48-related protein [Bacteroidota bacterium]